MIMINCPHCQTPYKVKEDNIPEKGGKMKCRNCGQTFTVSKPPAKQPPPPAPQPQEAAKPAPKPIIPVKSDRPTSWQPLNNAPSPAALAHTLAASKANQPDDPLARRLIMSLTLLPLYLLIADLAISALLIFVFKYDEFTMKSMHSAAIGLAGLFLCAFMIIGARHDRLRRRRNKQQYVSEWWVLFYVVYLYKRARLENGRGILHVVISLLLLAACWFIASFAKEQLLNFDISIITNHIPAIF